MRWQAHYGCGLRGPSRVGNCLTLGVGNYLTPPLGNYLTLLHLRLGNYLIVDTGTLPHLHARQFRCDQAVRQGRGGQRRSRVVDVERLLEARWEPDARVVRAPWGRGAVRPQWRARLAGGLAQTVECNRSEAHRLGAHGQRALGRVTVAAVASATLGESSLARARGGRRVSLGRTMTANCARRPSGGVILRESP